MSSDVAVVGGGAWGQALAIQASRAGARVALWAREPTKLPRLEGVTTEADLPRHADAILLAVPVQHMRAVVAAMRPRAPLVVCAKGVEAETLALPLEIAAALHPALPGAVLTGPTFAAEIVAGLPAAAVIAAHDPALRVRLVDLLATPAFRLYGNDDPLGAQIGGAAKNVVAIGAGAVIGAGFGENARAALVTRGLAEVAQCVQATGGRAETVTGLSGLGDLLLTCAGHGSRNFRFGFALGRGRSVAEALAGAGGVVEGAATASALLARASRSGARELPVCTAVAGLVSGRISVQDAVSALLSRRLRDE